MKHTPKQSDCTREMLDKALESIERMEELNAECQAENAALRKQVTDYSGTLAATDAANASLKAELRDMDDLIALLLKDKSNLEAKLYAGLNRTEIERAVDVCLLLCRPGTSDIHNEAWNRLQDIKAKLNKVNGPPSMVQRARAHLRKLVVHG